MKMFKKELFIILFVFLQTIGLMAQESRFKGDETLNVWAGAGCEYDIKQEGNKIIIDGGCGC